MTEQHLGAMVVVLRATRPQTIQHHMGRAIQKVMVDWIERYDKAALKIAHHSDDLKPYTASGLYQGVQSTEPVQGEVRRGQQAWIRFVGLTTPLLAVLEAFSTQPEPMLEIDHTPWEVERCIWETQQHPWAGRTTYNLLVRSAEQNHAPRQAKLEFISPTCFKSSGLPMPLPHPLLVFGSLGRRWSAFCEHTLLEWLPPFLEYGVFLQEHRTQTQWIKLKNPQLGFTGRATFGIQAGNEALATLSEKLQLQLRHYHQDLAKTVGLLGRYAFYSGVGIKTTAGMGLVKMN